jgi:hypothetical protein
MTNLPAGIIVERNDSVYAFSIVDVLSVSYRVEGTGNLPNLVDIDLLP